MDVREKASNEKRLIDADAMWRKFESEPWYDNADRDEIALPLVDDAPTVDAVEVVRCRECKSWHEETGFCEKHSYFVDGDGVCCSPADSPNWTMFDSDDFCSYGKRKEGAK